MVECQIVALTVMGSSPIIRPRIKKARLAESVDATDLKFVLF
tara:strand:- start:910 stop:1035 length:126 start_codon:yes stop_codon:yes gene_type:complete